MSTMDCGTIREQIPDVAAGRAGAEVVASVRSHVASCAECAVELRLAGLLFESRPRMPKDLSGRVLAAHRASRRSLQRPWWGITAAAVAALALGIGIHSRPSGNLPPSSTEDLVVDTEQEELWLGDDGVLAGAPVFDALSDEALAALLEELSAAAPGGQA